MLDDEAIRLIKEHGTFVVPNPYTNQYILERGAAGGYQPYQIEKSRQVLELKLKSLRDAIKAGLKVAYGTDSGVQPHGLNARQFAIFVEAGMTPLEAIRAATLVNADLLRMQGQVGTLQSGRVRGRHRRARRSARRRPHARASGLGHEGRQHRESVTHAAEPNLRRRPSVRQRDPTLSRARPRARRRLEPAQEAGVPRVDVVLAQRREQALVTVAALGPRQCQGDLDCFGDTADVVRVDDQRVGELDSRASQAR